MRIGKWIITWQLDIIDVVTGETVWFPGIGKWRREVNRNV